MSRMAGSPRQKVVSCFGQQWSFLLEDLIGLDLVGWLTQSVESRVIEPTSISQSF
jgi:hypothetical protein